MKWDVKIALYTFLAYSFYGVSYLISNGDFVVPYPLLFVAVPLVSILFMVGQRLSKYSIFHVLLCFSVVDKFIYFYSELWGNVSVVSGVAGWILLGVLLLTDKKAAAIEGVSNMVKIQGVVFLSAIFLLFANLWVTIVYFMLIAIIGSVLIRKDNNNEYLPISVRRILLLSSFIGWISLVTILSNLLN